MKLLAGGRSSGASAKAASDPIVIGDSIARGIGDANELRTDAAVGLQPDAILDKINGIGVNDIRGQNIILSSGISNDPSKLSVVQQQLDSLRARGANVTLVGVGSRADLAPLNAQLQEMAQKNGATFLPIQAGADGVHPASYRGLGMAGTGQGIPASSSYAVPDLGTALRAADAYADAHGLSMAARQHAEAYVIQQHSRAVAMGATERESLSQAMPDLIAGLGQGMPLDIPEDRIRAVFPPDKAQRMVTELQVVKQAGDLLSGLALAPYDEAVRTAQALQIPGSVQGGKIMLRRGQLAGPGMMPQQGQDDAVKPIVGPEDPTDMRRRMQVAAEYAAGFQRRRDALATDPAGYVQQKSPDVQRAAHAVLAAPNDPAAMQAYVSASTAQQKLLGVPDDKVRLLTNPQVAGLVAKLTKQDPAEGDTGAQLGAMAQQYGQAWPQVFGEMVEHGKLPRDYQVLATMDQPGQVVGRQDFQRMLTYVGQKGGAARMMEDLPDGTQKELKQNVQSTMEDFQGTMRHNTGGQRLYDDVKDSVMHLAAYRMATRAQTDPAIAVRDAYDDIIGQKYETLDTMLVPKVFDGQPLGMEAARIATRGALSALKAGDLAPMTVGGVLGMTDEDRGVAYTRDVKSQGFWVPNKDGSGLALKIPAGLPPWTRVSTTSQPVRRADGSLVQVLFRDMHRPDPERIVLPTGAGAAVQGVAALN